MCKGGRICSTLQYMFVRPGRKAMKVRGGWVHDQLGHSNIIGASEPHTSDKC